MARACLLLGLALLLVLPSANYQVFDGLPLARAPEFLALALLIPLLLGRGLRRLHQRWMSRWPRPLRVALIAAATVGLGLKVVLLASGTYQGFAACYRSSLEAPTTGPCERSFENPLFRFAVTRLDRAVHFGEHDWDLGFLNTVRFDRHYDGPRAGSAGASRSRRRGAAPWNGHAPGSRGSPTSARRRFASTPMAPRRDGPPPPCPRTTATRRRPSCLSPVAATRSGSTTASTTARPGAAPGRWVPGPPSRWSGAGVRGAATPGRRSDRSGRRGHGERRRRPATRPSPCSRSPSCSSTWDSCGATRGSSCSSPGRFRWPTGSTPRGSGSREASASASSSRWWPAPC